MSTESEPERPDGLSGICQPALGAGRPSLHSRGKVVEQRAFLLLAGKAVFPAGPVLTN